MIFEGRRRKEDDGVGQRKYQKGSINTGTGLLQSDRRSGGGDHPFYSSEKTMFLDPITGVIKKRMIG